LLERGLLEKFDPKKGRLRTYLRVCVDSFVSNEDKAGRRQKRGGTVPHVALDFAAAEEELGGAVMDPAEIPSPESLEEFFEKEWLRSLFSLAVEELRELCNARQRERTFRLFEAYDLEGDDETSYEQLAKDYAIAVTDVTNALAWARRVFVTCIEWRASKDCRVFMVRPERCHGIRSVSRSEIFESRNF